MALAVPAIVKGLKESAKIKELEDLKQNNPQAWVQLKQMEHEERLIEHEKHQMRHDKMKTGVGIGAFILRIITKQ
jgi:hypothetical protein